MQLGNFQPWLLFFIILIPALSGIAFRVQKKRLQQLATANVLSQVWPGFMSWKKRVIVITGLSTLVALLIVTAIFRPQWGFTWIEKPRRGFDLAIAIDVSSSMLAQDISPSRLERAKRKLQDLLDTLQGDRVSLVAFAGVAFMESPLTLDYSTLRLFLSSLSTDLIPVDGTNINLAIEESLKSLAINDQQTRETSDKAILILTDGEDFSGDLSSIKKRCQDLNVKIYILGIGTPEGGPIPIQGGFKKDKEGKIVVSRLNEDSLATLAKDSGGIYIRSISNNEDTLTLYNLGLKQNTEQSDYREELSKAWNEYFQIPLLLALVCFIWLRILTDRFTSRSAGSRTLVCFFFFLLAPLLLGTSPDCLAQSSEQLGLEARRQFEDSKYEDSLDTFSRAKEQAPGDPRFAQGKGAAFYRLGRFPEASSEFFEAASKTEDSIQKASLLFNAANSLVKMEHFEEAIKTYQDSLRLNPNDTESKDNLQIAKRLLELKKEQSKKSNKNQDKNKQQQDDKQQEEQQDKQQTQDDKQQEEQQDKQQTQDDKQQEEQQDKQQTQDEKQQEEQQDKQQAQDDKQQEEQQDKQQTQDDKQQLEQQDKQQAQDDKQQEEQQDKQQAQEDKQQEEQQDKQQAQEDKQQPEEESKDGSIEKTEQEKNRDKEEDFESGKKDNPPQKETKENIKGLESLDSIKEQRKALLEYRRRKALELLREHNQDLPEKDW